MSCHVMSCHIMSCHVMSCHVMSCHVMSCHVMSCHVAVTMYRIMTAVSRYVSYCGKMYHCRPKDRSYNPLLFLRKSYGKHLTAEEQLDHLFKKIPLNCNVSHIELPLKNSSLKNLNPCKEFQLEKLEHLRNSSIKNN